MIQSQHIRGSLYTLNVKGNPKVADQFINFNPSRLLNWFAMTLPTIAAAVIPLSPASIVWKKKSLILRWIWGFVQTKLPLNWHLRLCPNLHLSATTSPLCGLIPIPLHILLPIPLPIPLLISSESSERSIKGRCSMNRGQLSLNGAAAYISRVLSSLVFKFPRPL